MAIDAWRFDMAQGNSRTISYCATPAPESKDRSRWDVPGEWVQSGHKKWVSAVRHRQEVRLESPVAPAFFRLVITDTTPEYVEGQR
jgi:hypothetical protein